MTKPLSLDEVEDLLNNRGCKQTDCPGDEHLHCGTVNRILETAMAALKVVEAAKAFTDEWWFKPGPDTGCCGLCDGNLLPELKGRHSDDCHSDLVHEALAPFRQTEDSK